MPTIKWKNKRSILFLLVNSTIMVAFTYKLIKYNNFMNCLDDFLIIIQARLGSTRLPHKILLPFFDRKSIIELLIEKLKRNFEDKCFIVATTISKTDDALVERIRKYGVHIYRGAEEDVLERFIKAARLKKEPKWIVRICADNPFLLIDSINILNEKKGDQTDYVAFFTSKGIPSIKTHYGLWPEMVKFATLNKIFLSTKDKIYHEHVTNYIYTHSNDFIIDKIQIPFEIEKINFLRLTVDTKNDYGNLKELYNILYEKNNSHDFSTKSLLETINEYPKFLKKMAVEIKLNEK